MKKRKRSKPRVWRRLMLFGDGPVHDARAYDPECMACRNILLAKRDTLPNVTWELCEIRKVPKRRKARRKP